MYLSFLLFLLDYVTVVDSTTFNLFYRNAEILAAFSKYILVAFIHTPHVLQ